MRRKRKSWLDIAKGVGIILVVLGHCLPTVVRYYSSTATVLYKIIYYVHIPFFFILAGYTFRISMKRKNKRPMIVLISRQGERLLIPYVFYGIFCFLCFWIAERIPMLSELSVKMNLGILTWKSCFKGLLLGDNDVAIHLWFIYVLFLGRLIILFFERILKSRNSLWIVGIILLSMYQFINFASLELGIPNFLYMFIFLVVGYNLELEGKYWFNWLFIPALMLTILNIKSMHNSSLGYLRLYIEILSKILWTLFMVGFCQYISRLRPKYRLLRNLGRKSFEIYLYHQPFFGSVYASFAYAILGMPLVAVIITSVFMSIIGANVISNFINSYKRMLLQKVEKRGWQNQ